MTTIATATAAATATATATATTTTATTTATATATVTATVTATTTTTRQHDYNKECIQHQRCVTFKKPMPRGYIFRSKQNHSIDVIDFRIQAKTNLLAELTYILSQQQNTI